MSHKHKSKQDSHYSPCNTSISTADSSFDRSVDHIVEEQSSGQVQARGEQAQLLKSRTEVQRKVDFVQKYIQPLCMLIFDKLAENESIQLAGARDSQRRTLDSSCQNLNEGSIQGIQNQGSNSSLEKMIGSDYSQSNLKSMDSKIHFLFKEDSNIGRDGYQMTREVKKNALLIQKTLGRLAMFSKYDPEIFICAMIYLDRLLKFQTSQNSEALPFKKSSLLRKTLCVSVFLAGKMHSGKTNKIKLADFSKIVGIHLRELSLMESLVAHDVFNWNFGIDSEYFGVYKKQLHSLF